MTPRPFTLVAELTHRCPLRCPYCSNPIEYEDASGELTTAEWERIFGEAEALGVVQLHLTGGEPLVRRDLEPLVARARALGLYTNLVTSGVPLTRDRFAALCRAGLDHVQVSVQDVTAEGAARVAGYDAFEHKLAVMGWVKEEGLPLTVNVVLHRDNLGHVADVVALAERVGADRLELANTQYHAWAHENRVALLPTLDQLRDAFEVARRARDRLAGRVEVIYVHPDYYSKWPKACMDGWGRRFLHMTPSGAILPCHAARSIAGLDFPSAREASLAWAWAESPAFNRFRGEDWMREPCRSCDRRGVDFGGCRCQAFALTGDAAATDPACSLSPDHGLIEAAREAASEPGPRHYLYRGRARAGGGSLLCLRSQTRIWLIAGGVNLRRYRACFLVSCALAGAAAALACGASGGSDEPSGDGDQDGMMGGNFPFDVSVSDTAFAPAILKAENLGHVTLTVKNTGTKPHDFTVDGMPSADVPALAPGASKTIKFVTPLKEGTYKIHSTQPGDTQVAQFIID